MALNIKDIRNESPQVSIEGNIEIEEPDVVDATNSMIVGPAKRGPFFVPTEIRTPQEFREVFGEPNSYSSFSALQTLQQTDRIKFLRVGFTAGWSPSPMVLSTITGTDFPHFRSSTAETYLAVLIFDDKYKRTENVDPEKTKIVKSSSTTDRVAEDFTMETYKKSADPQEDDPVDQWRLSLDPFSGRYIERVLPPKVRIYQNFKESQTRVVNSVDEKSFISLQVFGEGSPLDPLEFDSFNSPRTPWIISQDKLQNVSDSEIRHRLFRFWVRSGGANQNRRFKLSITDIGNGESASGWQTFTVRLRKFEDSDLNQKVIEEFEDLSLNPDDERYIEKIIGTEFQRYNEETSQIEKFGVFDQNSYKIRVEASDEILRSSEDTVPFGFESYKKTFTESNQIPVYRKEQQFPGRLLDYKNVNSSGSERKQIQSKNLHLGIEFKNSQNKNFFQGIPNGSEKVGEPFKLDNYVDPESSSPDQRKFSLGFQGGSDGQSVYRERFSGEDITSENTFGFNFDSGGGKEAYNQAFDILRESRGGYEFNLLTTPELDIQNHNQIVRNGEQLVRNRGDALYVFDAFKASDSPEKAASESFVLDSTYAATYYGWAEPVSDLDFQYVPPSAVIPQTYARNDVIADPWFAPAGPNRGVVPNIKNLRVRVSRNDIDNLYENSVNVIKSSEPGGILLLGNKCFTKNLDSSLSSIDVRRTMVDIITKSKQTSRDYLFEPITPETGQNLKIDLSSILSTIQTREGIRDYEVQISTPTGRGSDDRNPNTITSTISVIPQLSSEYITVEFVIEEEGINVII